MRAGSMSDGHYSRYRSCKCLIPGRSRMVSILNECSGAGIHIFTLSVIKLQCWLAIRQSGCLPNNALFLYVPSIYPIQEHGQSSFFCPQMEITPFLCQGLIALKHFRGNRRIKHKHILHCCIFVPPVLPAAVCVI